jgi:transposase
MVISPEKRTRIANLLGRGETYSQIGRDVGVGLNTVKRWAWRFRDTGAMETKPIPGRPPVINPRMERQIVRTLREDPHITMRSVREWLPRPRPSIPTL